MIRKSFLLAVILALAVPAGATISGGDLVIPAAIRGQGANQSRWQMDLILLNTGSQTASVAVYWLPRETDNSSATPVNLSIPAGQSITYDDVVKSLLGLESATGAIRIVSNVAVAANSRVYNIKSGAAVGQGFEALGPDALVSEGGSTTIPGLRQDSANRANLFATAGPDGAGFMITILSPAGAVLGTKIYNISAWSAFYAPVTDIVGGSPGDVQARISVTSGSAWFAGARVENASGDPFTLAAVFPPPFAVTALAGTYTGAWYNVTFCSTGAATATVSVDEAARTFQVTLDLDGSVFGGADPAPETFSGSYNANGASLNASSPTFGDVSIAATPDGRFTGTATNVPNASVDSVKIDGQLTPTTLAVVYEVTFSGGGGTASGILILPREE